MCSTATLTQLSVITDWILTHNKLVFAVTSKRRPKAHRTGGKAPKKGGGIGGIQSETRSIHVIIAMPRD